MRTDRELKELLYKDEAGFLLAAAPVIDKVVNRFVNNGFIPRQDRSQLMSHIHESLLDGKISAMRSQFNGQSLVSTYLTRIVYNLCVRYGKKNRKYNQVNQFRADELHQRISGDDPHKESVLIQETERLNYLITLYGEKSGRLVLLLKMVLRLKITREDVLNPYPHAEQDLAESLMDEYHQLIAEPGLTDQNLFAGISPGINRLDQKENSPDALRKWIASKLEELAAALNAPPSGAAFDKESVKLLAEQYFTKLQTR
ncbi:hypothetical protein DYD21_00075 [Rhodohalobacter sp. SW132]|uniref:hypothetical protein n=1 Tax=Rhodohalobacter sp. SW132 TaxID=2293433 RepID=UPI000E2235AC|nr:hypothetical protein [Rhodohalobacter sp. SW132]REL38391.1 hypothetical protein DYD21_00075 [Rhodohalobacter sp. SW132]